MAPTAVVERALKVVGEEGRAALMNAVVRPILFGSAQSRIFFKCSARRSAKATMVKVGLAYPDVGKIELPAINKFVIPWTRQSLSTTPVRGSSLMRVVPM
jgi:hypothetical protein